MSVATIYIRQGIDPPSYIDYIYNICFYKLGAIQVKLFL